MNISDAVSPCAVNVIDVNPAPLVGVTVTFPDGVALTVIIFDCPSVPSAKAKATFVDASIADKVASAVISVVSTFGDIFTD